MYRYSSTRHHPIINMIHCGHLKVVLTLLHLSAAADFNIACQSMFFYWTPVNKPLFAIEQLQLSRNLVFYDCTYRGRIKPATYSVCIWDALVREKYLPPQVSEAVLLSTVFRRCILCSPCIPFNFMPFRRGNHHHHHNHHHHRHHHHHHHHHNHHHRHHYHHHHHHHRRNSRQHSDSFWNVGCIIVSYIFILVFFINSLLLHILLSAHNSKCFGSVLHLQFWTLYPLHVQFSFSLGLKPGLSGPILKKNSFFSFFKNLKIYVFIFLGFWFSSQNFYFFMSNSVNFYEFIQFRWSCNDQCSSAWVNLRV